MGSARFCLKTGGLAVSHSFSFGHNFLTRTGPTLHLQRPGFVCRRQIGFLFTYIGPLVFVLAVTILKEAYDDFKRWRRDAEANSQRFEVLTADQGRVPVKSSDIKVGAVLRRCGVLGRTRAPWR